MRNAITIFSQQIIFTAIWFKKNNIVILDDNKLSWRLRNFFSQKINLYIYNLGLKQNIIVTLDDYLLWLRNFFSKKKV